MYQTFTHSIVVRTLTLQICSMSFQSVTIPCLGKGGGGGGGGGRVQRSLLQYILQAGMGSWQGEMDSEEASAELQQLLPYLDGVSDV